MQPTGRAVAAALPHPQKNMLKAHQELAALVASAEAKAVEITNAGADAQAIVNGLRAVNVAVALRLANYKDTPEKKSKN